MFCIQNPPHCPVTFVLTVGDQISAEAPHKHSLKIEAHDCIKCIKVSSKPIHFSMHRQIHQKLPIFDFNCIVCYKNLSPRSKVTRRMATRHRDPCSLVSKCFVFKRRLIALWLLCLTVGDRIAAEAPHKHSLSVKKSLSSPPIFLCTAKYTNNCLYWVSTA